MLSKGNCLDLLVRRQHLRQHKSTPPTEIHQTNKYGRSETLWESCCQNPTQSSFKHCANSVCFFFFFFCFLSNTKNSDSYSCTPVLDGSNLVFAQIEFNATTNPRKTVCPLTSPSFRLRIFCASSNFNP